MHIHNGAQSRMVWVVALAMLGVASVARCHGDGDATSTAASAGPDSRTLLRPIGALGKRLMCDELCGAGLGGRACGARCRQMLPDGLPQSKPSVGDVSTVRTSRPRKEACPLLCANGLGEPLCECKKHYPERGLRLRPKTDWRHICEYYCLAQDLSISGCRPCPMLKRTVKVDQPYAMQLTARMVQNERSYQQQEAEQASARGVGIIEQRMADLLGFNSTQVVAEAINDTQNDDSGDIDWSEWCITKCKNNDGGVACNCDFLPLF